MTIEEAADRLLQTYSTYGVQELFSARDVAEMLDVSEEQAILEIEKAKAELLEQGEDMSKYIISEPEHQKFIVPPTRWTS